VKNLHLKLIPGREYLFTHKRKRTFRAVFKRIVRAPSTDTIDEFYYECEVDASLSRNPWAQMEDRALIMLRPSLVTVIQNAPRIEIHERMRIPRNDGVTPRGARDDWTGSYFRRLRLALGDIRRKLSR
jgi:hypothetical protein